MNHALASQLAKTATQWASHPLAQKAMDEVRGAVERFDARKHEPHRWALFHRRMAATLPWIRWAARLHHRRMARRYAAHAWAMDQAAAAACGIAA